MGCAERSLSEWNGDVYKGLANGGIWVYTCLGWDVNTLWNGVYSVGEWGVYGFGNRGLCVYGLGYVWMWCIVLGELVDGVYMDWENGDGVYTVGEIGKCSWIVYCWTSTGPAGAVLVLLVHTFQIYMHLN